MKTVMLSEVESAPGDQVFRASSLRPAAFALLLIAALSGLIAWHVYGALPLIVLIAAGAGLILGVLVGGASALKAMQPTNWLLICGQDRVLIKFRSYLNTAFPSDDPQVASLMPGEIAAVRKSTVTLRTPSEQDGWERNTSVFLDLSVNCDLSELKAGLEHEHTLSRTQSTVWQDYPVSITPDNVIRIEWKSPRTNIRPKISVALQALARHSAIDEDTSESLDLTRTGKLSKAEMDSQILALAERGRRMDAVKVARTAYGYSMREALDFVDGLSK